MQLMNFRNDMQCLIFVYGIASDMIYLHSTGIILRDLIPENVSLNEFLLPKICDFDLSMPNYISNIMTYQLTTAMKSNPTYSLPQILQFNEYSKSSDVYSFGFIVFEVMTYLAPFEGIANKNAIFIEIIMNWNHFLHPTGA